MREQDQRGPWCPPARHCGKWQEIDVPEQDQVGAAHRFQGFECCPRP
jgi:hypothetical protein